MALVPEQTVIDWVLTQSARLVNPKRILLFGSRARRDHGDRSDWDFAFEIDAESFPNGLARLNWEIEGDGPTLNSMDLVDLSSSISAELRESIEREGKVIYER